MNTKIALCACCIVVFMLTPVSGDVYVSNLGETNTVNFTITASFIHASSFTTDGFEYTLEGVTIKVHSNQVSGSAQVKIRADDGNSPGAVVEDLGTLNIPNAGTSLNFMPSTGLNLSPNTRYWVTVGDGSGSASWQGTTSTIEVSPGGWTIGDDDFSSNDGGASWTPTDFGPPNESSLFSVDASIVEPSLGSFFSDFEDLIPGPPFSPIGDGWLFFHTNHTFPAYFGDAPQGPEISDLSDDGAGNQYLNVYSDYVNFLPDPALTNFVYQERSFTAEDAAKEQTRTWSFDYAGDQSPNGVGDVGDASTDAYIRIFDNAFNLLAEETFDTSDAIEGVFQQGKVSLTFDAVWDDGGVVQFGFRSIRDGSAFPDESTGVLYDNVGFYVLGDANDDGVVANDDILPFVQALTMPAAYAAANPDVDPDLVFDMNGDGSFTNDDIVGFVTLLTTP